MNLFRMTALPLPTDDWRQNSDDVLRQSQKLGCIGAMVVDFGIDRKQAARTPNNHDTIVSHRTSHSYAINYYIYITTTGKYCQSTSSRQQHTQCTPNKRLG